MGQQPDGMADGAMAEILRQAGGSGRAADPRPRGRERKSPFRPQTRFFVIFLRQERNSGDETVVFRLGSRAF